MERTAITSTNIRSAGYDADRETLELEFNDGSVYQYASVPRSEYEGFMNANSKGKYFHANIKTRYSYLKL